jgi:hypothetical protein
MDLADDTVRRLNWLRARKWIRSWNVDQGSDGPELHLDGFDGFDGTMILEPDGAREWLAGYVAGVQRAS